MKQILALLCAFCCLSTLSAQSLLPLDSIVKVSFAEIVTADSLKKEQLYTNAKVWLANKGFDVAISLEDSVAGKLSAQHNFYVYARGYVSKKVHGQITYTTSIEVKDGKYRYTFNNFVFHYHKEDRNYKMVPSGKTKPLEETKASGWQSLWENHRKQTYATISSNIAELKTAMLVKSHSKKEPAVTAKKENVMKW